MQGPLELVVHALDEGVYREVARFGDEVVLTVPMDLRSRLSQLLDET